MITVSEIKAATKEITAPTITRQTFRFEERNLADQNTKKYPKNARMNGRNEQANSAIPVRKSIPAGLPLYRK
jgi:hypothetical protein